MKLVKILGDRQQIWEIKGQPYVITRVKDFERLGYETMIFHADSWYGREPLIEVWADVRKDAFTPFEKVAADFAQSIGAI